MPPCPDIGEVSAKIISSTGGFLGGTSLLVYMRPKSMKDAVTRVLVSTVAALSLDVMVADKFFDNPTAEVMMGVGFVIGFLSWNVLGAVAAFFENRQGQDVVQMMKSVKEAKSDD